MEEAIIYIYIYINQILGLSGTEDRFTHGQKTSGPESLDTVLIFRSTQKLVPFGLMGLDSKYMSIEQEQKSLAQLE